jgi:hypothetical protein
VCTLLLSFAPGTRWPLAAGAIRDEFADRPWDPPAQHWDGPRARLLGGRDRQAGGTWLAVDPEQKAMAALLNGVRRPPPETGTRPTRGTLALDVLATGRLPDDLSEHDRFHLVRAGLDAVDVWTWDAEVLHHHQLAPGHHIVVNLGLDTPDDPLVPHFAPLLAALPPAGDDLEAAWPAWQRLLAGDDLDPADDRALVVEREVEGRRYASTSAALVALSAQGVRYGFTASPADPRSWSDVATG